MDGASLSTRDLSGSQSVDRALRLLALVGREAKHGAQLVDLVEESGLNKPTARRLLLALMRAGLVEQEAQTRRYHLGEEAYVLGTLASRRHGLLELSLKSLRSLSDITMDTSFLSVRRDNYAVCLHREEGTYPVRTHALQVGNHHPLGIGAGSLAMLSSLDADDVENVLTANRKVLETQYSYYPVEQIRDDVAAARRQGYALNPGRIVAGSWGLGVAIRFPDGRIAGALSLAAIDSRMNVGRQPELVRQLRTAAERVESKLRKMFFPVKA
ncbi:IclR family transcriptional regulator [Microvirga terrestris]|uniref:IclR family transcriptional regulator n=1 Tax=Microvirga terrestris TaxID=2791024 RepID=A0ABS0HUY9_9HYPH|nr:IclR family transcriptional regulator [Microvirga terrestris]MBF9197294.1 IclR family transcriptional regulator [Microvirga terrestris]